MASPSSTVTLASTIPMSSDEDYIPTPQDVYAVQRDLLKRVPPELMFLIVEAAQYWPKVTLQVAAPARFGTGSGHWIVSQRNGAQCYLVTPPLSEWTGLNEGSFKPREIRFKIASHDQGWTTDNVQGYSTQYMGSRTWFEAAIIRDFRQHEEEKENHNLNDVDAFLRISINTREPKITINHNLIKASRNVRAQGGAVTTVRNPTDNSDVWHIQRNIRASSSDTIHEVVWTGVDPNDNLDEMKCKDTTGAGRGIGFVRSLQREDRIAVIARALYQAWENHVSFIQVEMTYSV
ncbi:hypothetical protein GALMADRAFT_142687 [Galerina marginata CBS 339.88]|uniref:Uncharacterized protein n=1 Tax=Galerina marginata (strain CBS 339.88) TaxID=685588 RepID=A0A067SQ45_GALM3|nr:hypothetical protein GALMADRAFT_142687 [Galerina marginata CBS 339.88]